MDTAIMYPKECRRNLHVLKKKAMLGEEIAYSMMLMTAALMDLRPEDEEVADMILEDIGFYSKPVA